MRLILLYIFCWGIALFGLYISLDVALTGKGPTGEVLLLADYANPLIKYSLPLAFLFLALGLFSYPVLVHRGIIPLRYYDASRMEKARSNLIIGSFLLVGLFFIYLAASRIAIISNKGKKMH